MTASSKTQCPAGYYSTGVAVACSPCSYGYTCSAGAVTDSPPAEACAKGGWCDGKDFFPCPAGTYNPRAGATNESACIACEEGKVNPIPGSSNASVCIRRVRPGIEARPWWQPCAIPLSSNPNHCQPTAG